MAELLALIRNNYPAVPASCKSASKFVKTNHVLHIIIYCYMRLHKHDNVNIKKPAIG